MDNVNSVHHFVFLNNFLCLFRHFTSFYGINYKKRAKSMKLPCFSWRISLKECRIVQHRRRIKGIWSSCSAGRWRQNDVVLTSMRRHHVATMSIRRHFDVICPLGAYLICITGTRLDLKCQKNNNNRTSLISCSGWSTSTEATIIERKEIHCQHRIFY